MKKLFFTLLFICISTTMVAQGEYKEILKEGRTWLIRYAEYYGSDEEFFTYSVVGDTVAEGKTWKIIESSLRPNNTKFAREENGRLYEYTGYNSEELMFDFNVQDGDTVYHETTPYWKLFFGNYRKDAVFVIEKDIIDVKGVLYNRYKLNHASNGFRTGDCWIEGIGVSDIIAVSHYELYDGEIFKFEACYDNGECVFDVDDFYKDPTVISAVNASRSNPSLIYDLKGRVVTNPQPRMVYIQDGKKFLAK